MTQKRTRRHEFARAGRGTMTRDQAMLRRKKERMAILKRRRRMLIASMLAVAAGIVLVIVYLLGGFEKKATETTLTVKADGSIIFEEIDAWDQQASKKEIASFAKEAINEYNNGSESKGRVKYRGCDVKNGLVYLKTEYENADTYADFTGLELFCGTVEEASAAGYDFNCSFVSVENGKKKSAASDSDISGASGLSVVILDQALAVSIPEDARYLSDEATGLENARLVRISDSVRTYIVYGKNQ